MQSSHDKVRPTRHDDDLAAVAAGGTPIPPDSTRDDELPTPLHDSTPTGAETGNYFPSPSAPSTPQVSTAISPRENSASRQSETGGWRSSASSSRDLQQGDPPPHASSGLGGGSRNTINNNEGSRTESLHEQFTEGAVSRSKTPRRSGESFGRQNIVQPEASRLTSTDFALADNDDNGHATIDASSRARGQSSTLAGKGVSVGHTRFNGRMEDRQMESAENGLAEKRDGLSALSDNESYVTSGGVPNRASRASRHASGADQIHFAPSGTATNQQDGIGSDTHQKEQYRQGSVPARPSQPHPHSTSDRHRLSRHNFGLGSFVNASKGKGSSHTREEEPNDTPPSQPFSLAGGPAMQHRKRRSTAVGGKRPFPPPGVALPMPRPKQQPSWARNRKGPLYSLGKPLPTKEEVDAQKQWQQQMEAIKQKYPDAEPPDPPPLLSQQTGFLTGSESAGGPIGRMSLDRSELRALIKDVIREFDRLRSGPGETDRRTSTTRDSASLSGGSQMPSTSSEPTLQQLTDHGGVSLEDWNAMTASQRQQMRDSFKSTQQRPQTGSRTHDLVGGSGISRLESTVVEDEEGLPIEEEEERRNLPRSFRDRDKTRQSGRTPSQKNAGAPAIAAGDKEASRRREGFASLGGDDAPLNVRKQPDEIGPAGLADPQDRVGSMERRQTRQSTPSRSGDLTATNSPDDHDDGNHHKGGRDARSRNRRSTRTSEDTLDGSEEYEMGSTTGESDPQDILQETHEDREEGEEAVEEEEEHSSGEEDDEDDFPNFIARFRHSVREPAAEFLGAFVLSVIGIGVNIQAGISSNAAISPSGQGASLNAVFIGVPIAWGAGVAMSICIAGGISGGHISPVISIVLAAFRGFPWNKLPAYVLAQILGFTAGSGTVYGLYRRAISIAEGGSGIRTLGGNGTASFFATYAQSYLSPANAFFQEFVNCAVLLILILAIGDAASGVPPPAGLNPIVIMFTITAIGLGLGIQTGYCLNPARDLGPRLVSWWAGYGTGVFDFRNQYWLWCCWLADIAGGLFGASVYDILIYTGSESPFNRRFRVRDLAPGAIAARIRNSFGRWRQRSRSLARSRREPDRNEKKAEV